MNNMRLKIRIILWALIFGVIFLLMWLKLVPTGEIDYVLLPDYKSDQLSELKPDDRLDKASDVFAVIGNPVYFNLRPPRSFETAELTIRYKNPTNLPLIEAGILADGKLWRHKTEPIENYTIDKISDIWDTIKEDGVMLLQKERKYEDVKSFLDNPPSMSEVAVYNYNLDYDYKFSDYQASEENIEVSGLLGEFQFYTYIKDEVLDMDISFKDLNLNKNNDTIDVFLYYGDKVIDSRFIDDLEEEKEETGEMVDVGNVNFKLAGMPEGVYRIEVRAGDDIVSNIKSAQSKLSFIGKIEFVENGNEMKLFTDSKKIQLTTVNPGSLQTVKIIELYSPKSSFADVININETYRQFESNKLSGVNQINLEKDGLIISGDGVFSFSENSLINPRIKKVDKDILEENKEINYIITSYDSPDKYEGWNIASASFDLSGAYMEDGKYGMMISAPGLRADDDIADILEIGEIRIKLRGKSVWGKIKEIINSK